MKKISEATNSWWRNKPVLAGWDKRKKQIWIRPTKNLSEQEVKLMMQKLFIDLKRD